MKNPNNKVFNVTETYEIYETRKQKHHINIREMCVKGKDLINFILSYKPETHTILDDPNRLYVTIQDDEDVSWTLSISEAR